MLPAFARGQAINIPVIGWLAANTPEAGARVLSSFRQGLMDAGMMEGKDYVLETRFASGDVKQLPKLAAELVQRGVAAIVTVTLGAAQAAKAATSTIPIVFTNASYVAEQGLVAAIDHPGGNVTGIVQFNAGLEVKRLLVLAEAFPGVKALAYPRNQNSPNVPFVDKSMRDAAASVHREFLFLPGATETELTATMESLGKRGDAAIMIPAGPYFTTLYAKMVPLAARLKVPVLYGDRSAIPLGGLMSYSAADDGARLAGSDYVPRILKGAKPADIPVRQPQKFEFVLNMKTAKDMGYTFPKSILDAATEKVG